MTLFDWRREFDWRLQNLLTISAPVIKRPVGDLGAIEKKISSVQSARYRALAAQYPLCAWGRVCTEEEALLNLYILDICDRAIPPLPRSGRGLDIGAGNWSYLPALTSWSAIPWDGVELDAHRRYWTLATRRAHAEYMLPISEGCRYLPGSLLDLTGAYACVTWFSPLRHARLPARRPSPGPVFSAAGAPPPGLVAPGTGRGPLYSQSGERRGRRPAAPLRKGRADRRRRRRDHERFFAV